MTTALVFTAGVVTALAVVAGIWFARRADETRRARQAAEEDAQVDALIAVTYARLTSKEKARRHG